MAEKSKYKPTVSKKSYSKLEENRKWRDEFMKFYGETTSESSETATSSSLAYKSFAGAIPRCDCRITLAPPIQQNFFTAKTNTSTKKYATTSLGKNTQARKTMLQSSNKSNKKSLRKNTMERAMIKDTVKKPVKHNVAEKEAVLNTDKVPNENNVIKKIFTENIAKEAANANGSAVSSDKCPYCKQRVDDSKCLRNLEKEMSNVRNELQELVKQVKSQYNVKDVLEKFILLHSTALNSHQESSVCNGTSMLSNPPNNTYVSGTNVEIYKTDDQFKELEQDYVKKEVLELSKSISKQRIQQQPEKEINKDKNTSKSNKVQKRLKIPFAHVNKNVSSAKTWKQYPCKKFKKKYLPKHINQKNNKKLLSKTINTKTSENTIKVTYHNPKFLYTSKMHDNINSDGSQQDCCKDAALPNKTKLEFVDDYQAISSCSSESSKHLILKPVLSDESVPQPNSTDNIVNCLSNSSLSVNNDQVHCAQLQNNCTSRVSTRSKPSRKKVCTPSDICLSNNNQKSNKSLIYSTTLLDESNAFDICDQKTIQFYPDSEYLDDFKKSYLTQKPLEDLRMRMKKINKLSSSISDYSIVKRGLYCHTNTNLNTEKTNLPVLIKKTSSTRSDFLSQKRIDLCKHQKYLKDIFDKEVVSISSKEIFYQCKSDDMTEDILTTDDISSEESIKCLFQKPVEQLSSNTSSADNVNYHDLDVKKNVLVKISTNLSKHQQNLCEPTTKITLSNISSANVIRDNSLNNSSIKVHKISTNSDNLSHEIVTKHLSSCQLLNDFQSNANSGIIGSISKQYNDSNARLFPNTSKGTDQFKKPLIKETVGSTSSSFNSTLTPEQYDSKYCNTPVTNNSNKVDKVEKKLSEPSVEDNINAGILDKIKKFSQNTTNFINKGRSCQNENQKCINKNISVIETGRVSVLKYIKQFENPELMNQNSFTRDKKLCLTNEPVKTSSKFSLHSAKFQCKEGKPIPPKPPKKPSKQNYSFKFA